jgi:ribose transport system ATP-binding protein
MSRGEVLFNAKGITKRFGPTVANKDIDIEFRSGEIHALAGENGSGKSTLLSIICGMAKPTEGEMFLYGQKYEPTSPLEANAKGIGFVVQELGLINTLTVADNIYLGNMKQYAKAGILNTKTIFDDAGKAIEQVGFKGINPRWKAGTMSVEKRKMAEIVKALIQHPKILVLDETTQALSYDNRKKLYEIINAAKEHDMSIVLVTHDLDEMVELADCVTVLRDGAVSAELTGEDISVDNIRTAMVGRAVSGHYYRTDYDGTIEDEVVLRVENLNYQDKVINVNFELHKGEILALCGLSDAGIHDVGKAIAGIKKIKSGTIFAVKENKYIRNPAEAVEAKIAYIPKDRDHEALMMNTNIRANLYLPSVKELSGKANFIPPARVNKFTKEAIDRFNVKCLGGRQEISALSGGNKQKISIGRWLMKDLDILIMDCPTRGVDVSVKAYIYQLMSDLKKEGKSMILIADEMAEAIGMADRLLVMKNGEINGTLMRSESLSEVDVIEVML